MTEIQNSKNESEKIFEQYLNSNGFQGKYTYEPTIHGKSKKPDYRLNWKKDMCFFEVKELRKKPNEPTGAAHIDPYSSLRREIDEAREKFREYKEYICSLVVFNVDDRQARLNPTFVFGAMLGDLGLKMDYDSNKGEAVVGSERNVFLDGGKMINRKRMQPQNTTISAIVVLEEFLDTSEIDKALSEEMKKKGRKLTGPERVDIGLKYHSRKELRSVVVENPFARIAFPDSLFVGPFDERWRWREDLNGKLEKVFVGNKLKALEEIKGKS